MNEFDEERNRILRRGLIALWVLAAVPSLAIVAAGAFWLAFKLG